MHNVKDIIVLPSVCWWGPCSMFGSSLPSVVCRSAHVLYLRYVCLFAYSGVQHILRCVFVFLHLVYPALPVSLDCSLPLAFSNVYYKALKIECLILKKSIRKAHYILSIMSIPTLRFEQQV